MKNKIKVILLATTICISNVAISEEVYPPGDSMFYYKMGGGRVFKAVPRWDVTTINLSLRASMTGLTCGDFDPKVTVSNTLNAVKDGLEDMYSQMEMAASAAIANLPGYILSKVNPNLYDLFMNGIAQAQAKFSLATKSCEMIEAEIRAGDDPFEEFATFSAGDTWKAGVGIDGVDITDVQEQAKEAKENGVNHPCHGRAGGRDQEQFLIVGDTAQLGYNRLLERDRCSSAAVATVPGVANVPMVNKFPSPGDIRAWANVVVGELDMDIDELGTPSSTPGAGIMPFINQRKNDVYNDIIDLYNGADPLNIANLSQVSAPGVVVTAQVIESLRVLSPQEASIFIDRISDEIAIADTVDSTLLVRRALSTGVKETDFYTNKAIRNKIEESIGELDDEVNNIMREHSVRKQLMGESIPLLLNLSKAKQEVSLRGAENLKPRTGTLKDGRIEN